jgi:hypothetical protein
MRMNGQSFFTRVPVMALLVLMSLAQPALAQGQAVSADGTVARANTDAARQPEAQGYRLGCYYDENYYCDPHGDRGRGDHGRGGGGGGGRGGRR